MSLLRSLGRSLGLFHSFLWGIHLLQMSCTLPELAYVYPTLSPTFISISTFSETGTFFSVGKERRSTQGKVLLDCALSDEGIKQANEIPYLDPAFFNCEIFYALLLLVFVIGQRSQ